MWGVAVCVGAAQSVSVKMHPRDLKTLPAEVFNLNRCDRSGRLCKPLPLQGQWHPTERGAWPLPGGQGDGLGWESRRRGWELESLTWFSYSRGSTSNYSLKKQCQWREMTILPVGSGLHCTKAGVYLEQPLSVELCQVYPGWGIWTGGVQLACQSAVSTEYTWQKLFCVCLFWYVAHIFPCWPQRWGQFCARLCCKDAALN